MKFGSDTSGTYHVHVLRHRARGCSHHVGGLAILPDYLKPVAQFAYITGWRIPSEVLNLQWPQIDFLAGEVRLNAGTTKNNDGPVFPFTAEPQALLQKQH